MSKTDGGPAFPKLKRIDPMHPDNVPKYETAGGMTLRDWFAGQALTGLFACETDYRAETLEEAQQEAADICYAMADAMLAKRERDQ